MSDNKYPDIKLMDKYKQILSAIPDEDGVLIKYYLDNSKLSFNCTCGCHSFNLELDNNKNFTPLRNESKQGVFKELDLETNYDNVLNVIMFIDKSGYLRSVDITYGVENINKVPDDIQIKGIVKVW